MSGSQRFRRSPSGRPKPLWMTFCASRRRHRNRSSARSRCAVTSAWQLAVGRKFGDFVVAWEVSPAYQQDGADYARLFDIAFAPEEAGAEQVPWRPLPVGTSPDQPWLLDLLALHGGEQRVAYLRTAVWC